jgi:hypothetical protein
VNGIYLTTAGRLRGELQELHQVVERALEIWSSSDRYYVDAASLNLHDFYAGVERMLELIADNVDQTKPSSAHWHQELLRQMTVAIPNVRPAVMSVELRNKLDAYRGFRHVVCNVYTFNLDEQQVEKLVNPLPETMEQLSQELLTFADFLEEVGTSN